MYLKRNTDDNAVKYNDMKGKKTAPISQKRLRMTLIEQEKVFSRNRNHLVKGDRSTDYIQSVTYREEFFDDAIISEKFNEYHVKVAASLLKNLEPINTGLCREILTENVFPMFLKPTNPEEKSKIISGLRNNKAQGFDGVTAEVLKKSDEIFSPVLSESINPSIQHEILSDCLKLAKVTPIPKSGKDREVSNLRPFSIHRGELLKKTK